MLLRLLVLCTLIPIHVSGAQSSATAENQGPVIAREFRGAWVASVANIDWPSRPGLTSEVQQAELLALLDRAVQLRLNAVILQVRPAADALYDSRLEPWSEYLTGEMGKAPVPYYDPLAFAVAEAHRRGLELHAWFNPFRARHASARSSISSDHVSRRNPALVKQYGRSLWLDPGEPEARRYSLGVIMDVVRRYDIDGVHIDDYFYPYRERDRSGRMITFPDDASWRKYRRSGGRLARDDWRRRNVDLFVEAVYKAMKREKPLVRFGVSPFGIWRPGNPPQVTGLDPYVELYADSRKWLRNGWLDYFAPQLYWPMDQAGQAYPVLLEWWTGQNVKSRHIWPGNFTSRVDSGRTAWRPTEIVRQVDATRKQEGASGNIHFSMRALMMDREGVATALEEGPYRARALVPASTWLDRRPPGRPVVRVDESVAGSRALRLRMTPSAGEPPWLWAIRIRTAGVWAVEIVPGWERTLVVGSDEGAAPDLVLVSAVDRAGNEGPSVSAEPATR